MALQQQPQIVREEERKFSKNILGRTVVSKTGKRFGEVGDIIFETSSGELIHIVLKNPTPYGVWEKRRFIT